MARRGGFLLLVLAACLLFVPATARAQSAFSGVVRDASGAVLLDSRTTGRGGSPPSVAWSEALPPHSLENVGAAEIRVISVELKQVAACG